MLAGVFHEQPEGESGRKRFCPGTFFRKDAIRFEKGGLTQGFPSF